MEGKETHSSILGWEILWTQRPSGLQSVGSKRVRKALSDYPVIAM